MIYIMSSVKIKKILIDLKGVQIPWFPQAKGQTIRIPLQKKVTKSGEKKEVEPKDKIVFDKIIQKDEEFGQPYLPIKLIAEVIKKLFIVCLNCSFIKSNHLQNASGGWKQLCYKDVQRWIEYYTLACF